MRAILVLLLILAGSGAAYWAVDSGSVEGGQSPSLQTPEARVGKPAGADAAPKAKSADRVKEQEDAGASASRIVPREMPSHQPNRPHGKGLVAWQEYYRNAPRMAGMIDAGAPGFSWWFEDPEMVALYEEAFERQLPLIVEEFAERRSRESDPSQVDPGSRAMEMNLVRYERELEAIGFQADWFRVQEPRSDVARHLSNYLVLQARAAETGKVFDLDGAARYRFNTPLDQVTQRAAGLDLRTMDAGRVNRLVDSYANVVLQAAELRSQMQVYEAAGVQATRELGVPAFSVNVVGAPFADEVLAYEAELAALWDAFLAAVDGGV